MILLILTLPFSASALVDCNFKHLEFQWTAGSGGAKAAGYIFYYGQKSSRDETFSGYDEEVDVGAALAYSLPVPVDDPNDYYFRVAAYDEHGLLGPPSQELVSRAFTVKANAQPGGMISPMCDALTYRQGEKAIFTIEPFQGYDLSDVLVDDVSIGAVSTFDFLVEGNHEVQALFAPRLFSVNAKAGPNGAIEPNGISQMEYLSSKNFKLTPAPGYKIDCIFVNGTKKDAANGIFTLTEISEDVLLEAVFAKDEPAPGTGDGKAAEALSDLEFIQNNLIPALEKPLPGAVVTELAPEFALRIPPSVLSIVELAEVQVALDAEFLHPLAYGKVAPDEAVVYWTVPAELSNLNYYFWRARVVFSGQSGMWSAASFFTVDAAGPATEAYPEAAIPLQGGKGEFIELAAAAADASDATIVVPDGAISFDHVLTVETVENFPELPEGASPLSEVYALGPRGFEFEAPVGVEFFAPENGSWAAIPAESTLALLAFDPGAMSWKRISKTQVENNLSLVGDAWSFSLILVASLDPGASRTFDQQGDAVVSKVWQSGGGGSGGGCFLSALPEKIDDAQNRSP